MVKGKKRKVKQKGRFKIDKILPVILLIVSLLFLTVSSFAPVFKGTGKAIGVGQTPIQVAPYKTITALYSEVKTIPKGVPVSINGAFVILTNAIPLSSDPSFATLILGDEVNLSTGFSSNFKLDSKTYTLKVNSITDKNISATLTNSSNVYYTNQVSKNKFSQFNFPNSKILHVGDYVLIGNGTTAFIYKIQNAGVYINSPCDQSKGNCYIIQLYNPVYKINISLPWSGYLAPQNIFGTFLTGIDFQYFLVTVQGGYSLPASVYNVSVEQYLYYDRYLFSPSHNVIYNKPNLPSVFVKDIGSVKTSLVAGSEIFLNSDKNKRTTMNINGKDYTIELSSVSATSATINITRLANISVKITCPTLNQACMTNSAILTCCSGLKCVTPGTSTIGICQVCIASGQTPTKINSVTTPNSCCSGKMKLGFVKSSFGYICY
jgi:hypothetical protein